mmetsp:Transcript_18534/g.58572  ORF Transcript_18534/g.58572 Transcript_18534/m.58572 type:complete len:149 (+) Transcript_18534:195-641(+)
MRQEALQRPPGLPVKPNTPFQGGRSPSWRKNPPGIAPRGHVVSDATPQVGEFENRKQPLMPVPAPPPADDAQDASGIGPSTIVHSPQPIKVDQKKEFAGVDTPVAVSVLKSAKGDANAALEHLLDEKSDVRERAQSAHAEEHRGDCHQ